MLTLSGGWAKSTSLSQSRGDATHNPRWVESASINHTHNYGISSGDLRDNLSDIKKSMSIGFNAEF